MDDIARLAHVLAFVVIANRRHTDLYEWGQRTRPLSLSAEIEMEASRAANVRGRGLHSRRLAGASSNHRRRHSAPPGDALHLSITDAMGHGVSAALNASLCVGSLRNSRNEGATLLEQVNSTNNALVEHAAQGSREDFVTGLIGRVDLRSGSMDLVNAGHVAPYLARDSDVTAIDLPADLPLGLFLDATYRGSSLALEPGDRLVLVTDGMLERNAAGIDLPAAMRDMRSIHPREAVRALADRVLTRRGTP